MAKWVKMLAITSYDLSSITRSYTMEEENQFPEINLTPHQALGYRALPFLSPYQCKTKTNSQQVKDVQKH